MARSAAAKDSMARLRLPGVVAAASPTCRTEVFKYPQTLCKYSPINLAHQLAGRSRRRLTHLPHQVPSLTQ